MPHGLHAINPQFLVYPIYVPPAKKKPESKIARTGNWLDSNAVTEVNHQRDSEESESRDGDSDSNPPNGQHGFDFTA